MSPAATISQNKEVFQYHFTTETMKLSECKMLTDRVNEAGSHSKAIPSLVLEKHVLFSFVFKRGREARDTRSFYCFSLDIMVNFRTHPGFITMG